MIRLMGIGDTVEFELRLAEAIAWCVPRANAGDPRNSLRHDSWQPHILAEDRISIVSSIVGHRGASSSRQTPRAVQSADDLHGGRLLVYFPDAELSDGAAELASN